MAEINHEALVAIRTGRNIGLVALAREVGITRETLRKIERGITTKPRDHTTQALADALGVPVEAITLREDVKESA